MISPGILSSTDDITVIITVAMDTVVAQGDHDPKFGISDGKSFIGFQILDKGNYHNLSSCYSNEADIINKIFTNIKAGTGSFVVSRKYVSEVKLQIRPKEI